MNVIARDLPAVIPSTGNLTRSLGACLLALGVVPACAHAEALRNLPVCSTARLIEHQADRTPDCTPNAAKRKIAVKLTARTGPRKVKGKRHQEIVAGYDVSTDNYNGAYMPPVIEARAGDKITFSIRDELSPEVKALPMMHYVRPENGGVGSLIHGSVPTTQTNLHTHGLIVSPNNSTNIDGNGDNPFRKFDAAGCRPMKAMPGMAAVGCAPSSGDVVISIPDSLAAGVYGNAANAAHPSGLFWYHPHIHGLAQHQVNGGMAGLISIGDPRTAIVDPADPSSKSLRSKIDLRYLAIKDIQITADDMPEAAATRKRAPPGTWQGEEFDPTFCGELLNGAVPTIGKGYCTPNPQAGEKHKLWLFTVNGQRYPTITIPPNRGHIWRMANLSATVTYELVLTDVQNQNDEYMRVVALDGVVIAPDPKGAAGALVTLAEPIKTKSIQLMPASRVEIYVPNFEQKPDERMYVLKTKGFRTGADADLWPAVDLAEVRLMPVTTGRSDAIKLASFAPGAVASALTVPIPSGARRVGDIVEEKMPLCFHNKLKSNQRRVITFATDKITNPNDPVNAFEVLEIGTAVWEKGKQKPESSLPVQTMQHDMDFMRDDHACAAVGSEEVWEIVNETEETHNFHMHQVKFRLATAAEIEESGGGPGPAVRSAEPVMAAADRLFGSSGDTPGVWHDTFPIPPGSRAAPSRVFLHIAFTAPEQIGRFVYHCHILEHEDKGMMAPFEVLAP